MTFGTAPCGKYAKGLCRDDKMSSPAERYLLAEMAAVSQGPDTFLNHGPCRSGRLSFRVVEATFTILYILFACCGRYAVEPAE